MAKRKYPVVFWNSGKYVLADAPDFPLSTQGNDKADAEFMAADAIKEMILYLKDKGKRVPAPSRLKDHKLKRGRWAKLIEVDI